MNGQMGIKETLELLDAVKLLVLKVGDVLEDGKVNLKDLPVLLDLVKKVQVLKTGADGAELIAKEVKDLSQEEAALLLAKVYEVISSLKGLKQ